VDNTNFHVLERDFVSTISNLCLKDDKMLVSCDVVSLFTDISTNLAAEIALTGQ